jgi:putative ABC transport system permease protein
MLWKKVFRDLRENKGAYLACMVIIILGLMVYIALSMVLDNLRISQQAFYKDQNFADGFVEVQALPYSEIQNLQLIEGVEDLQGRLVKDVRVLLPDREDNVYLRLISTDPKKERSINGMRLLQGASLNNEEAGIWVDNMFFDANNLSLNDDLLVVTAGKKEELRIAGVGQSPEFIYALRTMADLYPNPEQFGIAFVPLEVMQSFFPEQNAFNDIVFTLAAGVAFDDVKEALEYELKPYGLTALYPRDDQISHLLLTMELDTLGSMSKALPIMFLLIAAAILYITLKRLIEQQRGQIGILKALGYTQKEIMLHYLSYAFLVGLAGGIVGVITGAFLFKPLIALFQVFFNMPGLTGGLALSYLLFGVLLSLTFSLVAGYHGCKRVLTLEPAEAMRPPAPPIGKSVLLERVKLVWGMLTVQGMMAVRNISRNKGRSAFVFVGIMLCFAISSFTLSMNNLYQKMLFDQYEVVELYDVKATLSKPLDAKAVTREFKGFYGVSNAEAMTEVPVTLKHKWLQQDVTMLGLLEDGQLYSIVDTHHNRVELPKTGVILTERLAGLLDAKVGTILNLESPMMKQAADKQIEVVAMIPQYVGMNAYMSFNAVQGMLGQGGIATSVMLNMEEQSIPQFQEKYIQSDLIAGIDQKHERLEKMQEMMKSYGSMIYIYMLLGIAIGFAIIYSSSIITVSERNRELASMMVLGMTPAEVLSVITFEQWFVGIPAMVVGIPLSKSMLYGMSRAVESDVFTMPVSIPFSSFVLGCLVTCGSIWVAQRVAARKIRGLSLVGALKSAE